MIGLMSLKKFMFIKPINKVAILLFVIIINFNQKASNFNDDSIVPVKVNKYRIHFWYISKDQPIHKGSYIKYVGGRGRQRLFVEVMKYFTHIFMGHEIFFKIFDGPHNFFLCFILVVS